MNTNSNTYTVIYTAAVVAVVAAVLAFVSQKLGPMQAANEKAETVSQILTAAGFGEKESWAGKGNAATLDFYRQNIAAAQVVTNDGSQVRTMDGQAVEIYSVSDLKAQNYKVKGGQTYEIPVYAFNNGVKVVPVYGAGLWGPVWGYIALAEDNTTIVGAYFDHEGETPGLGGKIKDDPSFRAQFAGKVIDFEDAEPTRPFAIIKGGAKGKANAVDAITGATMTSKGLDAAIKTWVSAYQKALCSAAPAEQEAPAAEESTENNGGQSNE